MTGDTSDLHLSTPLGRLALLTLLMALNLPFWGIAALAVPVAVFEPPLGALVLAFGLPVSGLVAGLTAARFGRVGGNLAFRPGSADLDGKPVVALRNWSVDDGWIEVVTRIGPEIRFGSRSEISDAVHRLVAFPGVQTRIEDGMDGFAGQCDVREARLDRVVAIPWAALSVGLGLAPLLFFTLADPGALLCLGIMLVMVLLVLALPAAGAGVMLAELLARHPRVSLSMRGNLLEVHGALSATRVLIDDPRGVVFAPHSAGTCVTIPTKDGPIRLVCTRPFATGLQERLARLRPLDGDIELVPESLRRVRAARPE